MDDDDVLWWIRDQNIRRGLWRAANSQNSNLEDPMNLVNQTQYPIKYLDEQWIHLMIVARNSGFTEKEIRDFFQDRKIEKIDEASG